MSPDAPRPPDIRWSGVTHVGRFRPNNEDSFLALKFDGREVNYLGKNGEAALEGADFVFAVSDGMGGAKSGEFASRVAVDRITKLLPASFRLSAAGIASGFSEILIELLTAIHADMLKLGTSYSECAGMGATLSLCWFRPDWMYFGHVGDSRIYYLPKDGGLTQVTEDHSHVGWLRRKGEINEREARTHPRRNALSQALGAGSQFVEPQVGAVGHRPGDRFLICSDGLIDGLWDRQIEEIVRDHPPGTDGPTVAQGLVDEAVRNSGRDNTTAVLVEIPAAPAARGAGDRNLVFVYGTLKQGHSNHHFLGGQTMLGPARSVPGYTLYDLEGYPGMVAYEGHPLGVGGEVWSVDDECLARLDALEGTSEGLYRREAIPLLPPFAGRGVQAYVYLRTVEDRRHIGSEWTG